MTFKQSQTWRSPTRMLVAASLLFTSMRLSLSGIRCGHFGRFFLRKRPANPSEVGVHFFGIFCSFEFSRDRHCNGTRKCPQRLSTDKLVRVAVPSQLRANLHTWRLPRTFKNASELGRRCSTPHHAQHAGPHTYIPTSATRTPTEQHTGMEDGGDGVVCD